MAEKSVHHIILLPRQDYWQWVDAIREYAVTFDISVTPLPKNALDFHHPNQIISIINAGAGYPQYGDIVEWFRQRSPDVRLDVILAATPDLLIQELAGRIASGSEFPKTLQTDVPQPSTSKRDFKLVWPTDFPTIVQGFGENPELYRRWGLPGHDGVDIKAPVNSNVYACADGAVVKVHDGSGNHPYGIHVRILHPNGYRTIYGHLNKALVSSGQVVKAGDVIGLADGTGNSSGNVLHLALKKDGATASGLTPFPHDLIDPTPFLGPSVSRHLVEISDRTWLYDHCLVGVVARPDGSMQQADWDVVREARIEAIKVHTSTPPEVVRRAMEFNPSMLVVANLSIDFRGRNVAPADFARMVENDALELYDQGVQYFEIHNDPNLVIEGYGSAWRDGYEFGQWYLQVIGHLRPKLPVARFGWPGLSLGPRIEGMRGDALRFLEEARGVISQTEWIGCHCYWQDDAGMMSVDGGVGYKIYRDEWPSRLLMITEFSNTSPAVPAEEKGRQYATYYQMLAGQEGLGAAFASVVSSASGYINEVWRSEDGLISPIVDAVAKRLA